MKKFSLLVLIFTLSLNQISYASSESIEAKEAGLGSLVVRVARWGVGLAMTAGTLICGYDAAEKEGMHPLEKSYQNAFWHCGADKMTEISFGVSGILSHGLDEAGNAVDRSKPLYEGAKKEVPKQALDAAAAVSKELDEWKKSAEKAVKETSNE